MPTLRVHDGQQWHVWDVADGANLRRELLDHNLSPYTTLTERLNCGGRGLCATCGVFIDEQPAPTHWHDRLAEAWRYPRLSCQITVDRDLTVRLLPDKRVWGKRHPR
ncbi:MAG: 2Fe-2S iron-sulfur cluster binding domain-containing protein [Rhodothermales bacterium]